jgi:hypothetical protein
MAKGFAWQADCALASNATGAIASNKHLKHEQECLLIMLTQNKMLISAGEWRALRYALQCNTHPMRTQSMRRARAAFLHTAPTAVKWRRACDCHRKRGSVPAQRGSFGRTDASRRMAAQPECGSRRATTCSKFINARDGRRNSLVFF